MIRPWPGSKCSPTPDPISAVTRSWGSFTTSLPLTNMANTLPFTFKADEPNILAEVTPGLPDNPVTTDANSELDSESDKAAGRLAGRRRVEAFFAVMPWPPHAAASSQESSVQRPRSWQPTEAQRRHPTVRNPRSFRQLRFLVVEAKGPHKAIQPR